MPVLTVDFLGWPTNCRPAKSGSHPHAINAATALRPVLQSSLYRFNLKSAGKIRRAGWAFAIFACVWIGLNAHSGWIRYHEFLGDRAFKKVQLPDELALAEVNPARWLSPADRQNIVAGKEHLQAASGLGLFVNSEVLPKLAWFEYLLGDTEQSLQLLDRSAAYQKGEAKALSLYYRGAILNR